MLCLDRGFYAANVFQYLQDEHIPHIVPAKNLKGSVRAKLKGRKSTEFEYILNEENKDEILVSIVDCVLYSKGKDGKHGIVHYRFVVFGTSLTPRQVRNIYSHRFGIESSYRMKNDVKAKTTSTDPVIRYFYKILAFVLQNVWISIQWTNFVKAQRGPKTVDKCKFDLKFLVNMIRGEVALLFPLNKPSKLNLNWI
jgi:putative transposase